MNVNNISIFDLSPPEKLQLVEDLWDDLAATPSDVPMHEWQKQELERRKSNLMNNPLLGISWDTDLRTRDAAGHKGSCSDPE